MKTKQFLLFTALVFFQKLTFAAAPAWSVNPAAFMYSMTVTAVAEINCTELTSPSNRIGAFVGSDCRGTALTSTVVNGRYIASMVVYSNVPSGETITFKIYNVANDSVYEAKTTAAFQDNAAFGVSSSPFVIRNNNAPTAMNLNVQNVNEGQPTNTTVGALSTTDPDPSETFTYSLVSGTGSADNSNFAISGSNLVTNVVLNYATKTSHSIRVRSTDANGCYFEKNFTITVNDVNTTPTGIIISDSTINENSTSLTAIGSLTAVDYDAGENFIYSLVAGMGSTDNASFNINGSNLRSLSSFNYEVKSSYSIRVKVTDVANNTFERIITILVKDVNDAPTSIDINGSTTGISFAENKPLGTVIGLINTTDEDAGNSFIYTFVNTAGNNNDKFTIAGNQLRTNDLFDYEVRQNYVVFLQTNDGNGGLLTRQFALNVTDSNDAPTSMSLTSSNINENQPANTFIGRINTVDPDAGNTFTYTLVTGAGSGGNANFRISNDSLYTTAPFDYESVAVYSIRVNVNDGHNGNYQQAFNITVLNANDAPTDILLSSDQIAENLAANAVIGTLSTNDQDVTNTFVYTLVGGTGSTDNASFNISGNNLRASASFDYETKNTYSIRLKTTDNQGAYFEKIFTINITNVSDAPTNITLSRDTISENRPVNTLIGIIESVSQDTNLSYTYSFDNNVTGNSNTSFVITGKELRSNAIFDYETKSSYFVYIISNDGAGGTFTKQFQINIINRNDAPTDIVVNNRSVAENAATETFISRITSVDPDNNTSFTYTLVSGAGDNDNTSFAIRADSLFSTTSFDFETKNVYNIRMQTNDNLGGTFQKIIVINVTNVNDNPTNVTLSEVSINENLPANTTIGTFTTTDQDTGNTFIYSLVTGTGSTDNGNFLISGTSLRSSTTFDYEVKSSYSIRVKVTDNFGGTFEKQFTISINNLNDAPTNIALSNDTITENKALNTLIGTFTTTDQDANSFTYSFSNVAGNNNDKFTISGNQLRTNSVFDFEALSTYFIYVQTNDGNGGTFVKQFQINIKDTNDAPSDLLISNNTVNENSPAGTFVGKLSSIDPDHNTSFTYSFATGAGDNDNSSFTLRSDSLFSNAIFDYELKHIYSIRLKTDDNNGGLLQKVISISINNTNDAPTNISLNETDINENLPAYTTVGNFTTTDQDTANSFAYSLVSGSGSTDNGSFTIVGNNLRTTAIFDYEVKNSYSIRVRTTDNANGTFEKVFTISVINMNDAPTNIALSNDTISENRPINSVIGTFSTTDQDANSFTYSFSNVNGNNNSMFNISGNQLRTNASFNYEQLAVYFIYVQTNDGNGGTFVKQFQINVKDSNDAPTDISLSNPNLNENLPVGAYIGQFSSTDPDPGNTFTYAMVSGTGSTHNASFIVRNDSLFSAVVLNFETQNTYSIRVRTLDNNGLSFQKAFTITVNDSNDLPTGITLSTSSVSENSAIGTTIGTLNTIDPDAGQTFSYALVNGAGSAHNSLFSIQNGALKTNAVFNYETQHKYTVRIQTNDGNGGTFTDTFNITVLDVNDAPTNITLSNNSIPENRPTGSLIGTLNTTDEDANTFTYSFAAVGNNDNSSFILNGNELKTNALFNYEVKQLYVINIQTNDGNGGTYTKQFLVNITDSNDAPTDITLSANSITENLASHTFIGRLTTTDIDAGTPANTYTLVSGIGSTHNNSFSISNDSLFSAATFNFEAQNSYNIRIKTLDNGSLSFEKAFTISVRDSNDYPTAISLSNNVISENQQAGSTVGNLSSTDADALQTFSYTLVSGPGSTNNNVFAIQNGVLKTNAIFNYEVKNTYTVRIQTNDGNGGTFTDTFNITITDANDAPTNITLSNNSIPENRVIGSAIGSFTTTDEDANTFSYSFANIGTNDNSNFILSGNELKTNAAFNYEVKQLYVIHVQTNDGFGGTFTKQFLINITDSNDAPTDIALGNNLIDENLPVHSYIGKFSISDVDGSQGTNTYTFVNGTGSTNNGNFMISNDSLFSNAVFNFETQSAYTIRVKATDNGGLSIEKAFAVSITDANDAPTALVLSANIIKENSLIRTGIGRFTTTDADAVSNFTYSLVSGTGSTDNASFIISGNELKSNAVFNKETKSTYSIRVQTNDNRGGTFENAFTITVEDSNDVPTNIILSNNSIAENRTLASVIGTLSTTDEDASDIHIYSLVNITGNDNSSFFINGNELRTNTNFDYETKRVYNIYIQTNDGYSNYTKQFVINITDSNDAPTNITLSHLNVDENTAAGTFIGTFYTSDADASGAYSYSLVNGPVANNNVSFRISNDSLYSNATFDYETKPTYTIRVRSTDNGGLWFELPFQINVNNANDAPTDIMLNTTEISENKLNRSLVAIISTKDADANTFSYSLVSGTGSTDNSSFVIIGNELRSNRVFNYELKSSYNLRIQTNDGNGGTFEKAFTINILDSNDVPSNIVLSTSTVVENAPIGYKVCDLSTIDEDLGQTHSYSFVNVSGNANSNFIIVGDELRTNAVFDFETKNFYLIHLQTTDAAGASLVKQFIINIKDTNDAPIMLDLSNNAVDENQPARTYIGILTSSDPDFGDSYGYGLTNGAGANDNNSFIISGDSLLTNASFNFEVKKTYSIRLLVGDNAHARFEKQFTITINDINDAPTALSINNLNLPENAPANTEVGTFTTKDVDAVDEHTYTLVSGTGSTDNSSFEIIGDKLISKFVANYENKSSYNIRVKLEDKGGDSIVNVYTVSITDGHEKPSIGDHKFNVSENALAGTVVGTVAGSSPDAGADLKYSFAASTSSAQFAIDPNTGEITVSSSLDYEKQSKYTFKLIVKDEQAIPMYDTATLTIDVNDEIETKQNLPANNYISPNNDGFNDVFAIDNVNLYTDYSLTVYNESGMEVYKIAANYNNDWDGTYNGKTLPTGVYFYVFYNSKTSATFKGALNIIK